MCASLARAFLEKAGARSAARGPPIGTTAAAAAPAPPTRGAPLTGGIEAPTDASGPWVVPRVTTSDWDGVLTVTTSPPPLARPPLTPLALTGGGTRVAPVSAVTPGARCRATPCTRQRSGRSSIRPRVGGPRLLRRERISSTVTRDTILKSQSQPGAWGWCEVNGGQWGKVGGAYRPERQRARRAKARAILGIGTNPVVVAVAYRLDCSCCHTPRSGVTTIRILKIYWPTEQTTRISLPAHRMGGSMHRARTIEHTRPVRVCWPRMHGACTPQPRTLPGACMRGLRQGSANGPHSGCIFPHIAPRGATWDTWAHILWMRNVVGTALASGDTESCWKPASKQGARTEQEGGGGRKTAGRRQLMKRRVNASGRKRGGWEGRECLPEGEGSIRWMILWCVRLCWYLRHWYRVALWWLKAEGYGGRWIALKNPHRTTRPRTSDYGASQLRCSIARGICRCADHTSLSTLREKPTHTATTGLWGASGWPLVRDPSGDRGERRSARNHSPRAMRTRDCSDRAM